MRREFSKSSEPRDVSVRVTARRSSRLATVCFDYRGLAVINRVHRVRVLSRENFRSQRMDYSEGIVLQTTSSTPERCPSVCQTLENLEECPVCLRNVEGVHCSRASAPDFVSLADKREPEERVRNVKRRESRREHERGRR